MDKEHVKGAAKEAEGSVKKAAGDVSGDSKLRTEGEIDKAEGKMREAAGDAKDKVREAGKEHRK